MPKIVIQKYERTAQCFLENLGKIQLEMMLIPGGAFIPHSAPLAVTQGNYGNKKEN